MSRGLGDVYKRQPEPFDTALALLGLAKSADSDEVRRLIARGRAFLIARQRDDGSWAETTRPPGGDSYAQRVSTTGWATLALLATRDPAPAPSGQHRGSFPTIRRTEFIPFPSSPTE